MKWSELYYDDFYIPYDEKQKAVRGYFLASLGVDLNHIPEEFFERCQYLELGELQFEEYHRQKIFVCDIVGSCSKDYAGDAWITAFLKIKRGSEYILRGIATSGKIFYILKRKLQSISAIKLIRQDGKLFIERNGNHRVTFYKMMYFAQISKDDVDLEKIKRRFWLYADVRDAKTY